MRSYKLSILHVLFGFASKTERGSRSTVLEASGLQASASRSGPIFPRSVFESWIFSHLPFSKGGSYSPPFTKGRGGGITEAILNGIVFMKRTTKPAPHLKQGYVCSSLVPRFRGDDAWIPAFAGMTSPAAIHDLLKSSR